MVTMAPVEPAQQWRAPLQIRMECQAQPAHATQPITSLALSHGAVTQRREHALVPTTMWTIADLATLRHVLSQMETVRMALLARVTQASVVRSRGAVAVMLDLALQVVVTLQWMMRELARLLRVRT